MSIQIYILSMLMEEKSYPYKLKKQLSEPRPLDKLGNLTESKLYYHFDSLSKSGLIEQVEVIKEEHRPDKQVFAITEKGREMLPKKIYNLFEKAEDVKEFVIGLFFLRFVDKARIIRILEGKLEEIGQKENQFKILCERLDVSEVYKPTINITNNYMLSRLDIEIKTIKQILEQLSKELD